MSATWLQDNLLAEQLQQAADKAQKWKGRCIKLRQELADTQTSAASQEAALNVSIHTKSLACVCTHHEVHARLSADEQA